MGLEDRIEVTTMKSNPVMQRVNRLTRSWQAFIAQPDARILRWCLKTDSARMLDSFLAWHTEEDSELKDLFIVFPVPFENPEQYAHALVQHLADEFEVADEDLKSMELPTGWQPARSSDAHETIQDFIAAATSLQMHYADFVEHVALVLMPASIEDREQWIAWLHELARVSYWPASVRVLIADWIPALPLKAWASDYDKLVVSHHPVLDMQGLPQEILAHLPGVGPGFDFRRLFVQLGTAASRGRLNQVKIFAAQALIIANAHGWYSLAAAVEMVVAGAFSSAGKDDSAIQSYRQAREVAMLANSKDPSRLKTVITTNFALSGSLVGQGKYDEARKYYYEAAKLADEADDSFAAFESRRMASYCSEQLGDHKSALKDGQEAMRLLESVPPDDRLQSTAPHLALRLTEMSGRPELAKQAKSIEQLCNNTLAGDWRSVARASMKP